jgi:hypothetical protein
MEIRHRDVTPSVHPDADAAGRGGQMRTAMRRYARMLARGHQDDE